MRIQFAMVIVGILFCCSGMTHGTELEIRKAEFIFDQLPHPSCHASTLAESKNGLVACWFGGKREGDNSVGIWISRETEGSWSKPIELVNGLTKGKRYPCWNPVLFQMPKGDLLLFYKVGPSPRQWWGMMMKSSDGGKSWSDAKRLPDGILGPIKNKPILLEDGRLLCGSSTEHDGWKVHMEWSRDPWDTKSWQKTGPLENKASKGAIQPTLLKLKSGLGILCRNQQRESILFSSSTDGKTWSPLVATSASNPNSGIDAVTARSGLHWMVYNPTKSGRSPLSLASSTDGMKWERLLDLETEKRQEFSYPAIIQTSNGDFHITYTWKRKKIKHVVIQAK